MPVRRPTLALAAPVAATLAVAVATALAAAPARAQENLIRNGGFEARAFADWTLGGNLGDTRVLCDNGLAFAGQCYARLGPNGGEEAGFLRQSFATPVGAPVAVSFWLRDVGFGLPNVFAAYFDGREVFALRDVVDTPREWTRFRFELNATRGTSDLEFRFRDAGTDRYRLDNVRAEVVPEPSTYALLGAGLAGVGWVARRRRGAAGGGAAAAPAPHGPAGHA